MQGCKRTFGELLQEYNDIPITLSLIEHHSGIDKASIYVKNNEDVNFDINIFRNDIERYKSGEPYQHIVGYEYFLGRKFKCNKDVLIPRYETEELVNNVLIMYRKFFQMKNPTIVDVGTGSGAIAASLSLELDAKVYATDISEKALAVARENCAQLNAKVTFLEGDLLTPLIENDIKVDILISNPPYIRKHDFIKLSDSVIDYDPHTALFGEGEDGLGHYRRMFVDLKKVLNERYLLAFEFGYDQKDDLEVLVKEHFPSTTYEFKKDMNSK